MAGYGQAWAGDHRRHSRLARDGGQGHDGVGLPLPVRSLSFEERAAGHRQLVPDEDVSSGLGRRRDAPGRRAAIDASHADAIKEASPATRWLTTSNLTDWNFGTLQQRLEGVNWVLVGDRIESLLVGRYFWAGLIIVAVIFAQRREFWIGMAATVVLPVAVFFNLFVVHDYYLIALTPGIAALLGLTTDLIWRHGTKRVPAALVILGLAAAVAGSLVLDHEGLLARRRLQPPEDRQRDGCCPCIRRAVPSNEPLVLQGLSWDPTTLYYAHRRGLMLDPRIATPAVAHLLRSHDFRYWYATRPTAPENDLLRTWPWIASTGRQAYRMSQAPSRDLEDAAFVATRDRGAIDAARSNGSAAHRVRG